MPFRVFRYGSEDPNSCFQLKNTVFRGEYEGALVSFSTRVTRSYILITSPMYWHVPGCSASSLVFLVRGSDAVIARGAQISSVSRPRPDGITWVIQFVARVCRGNSHGQGAESLYSSVCAAQFSAYQVPQGTQFSIQLSYKAFA